MSADFEYSFAERVYMATSAIPKGKVATYGQIARMIGSPRSPRAVGNALHNNPHPVTVPCHRVVNASGKLAKNFGFEGAAMQKQLLEQEGVVVQNESRVDLKKYQWKYE